MTARLRSISSAPSPTTSPSTLQQMSSSAPHPSSATIVTERAPETDEDKDALWSSTLSCHVSDPQKELEGTQNQYITYLVTTESDFPAFQSPEFRVRRRFSDFVYLYNVIVRDYPACAVPPLPDKQRMGMHHFVRY